MTMTLDSMLRESVLSQYIQYIAQLSVSEHDIFGEKYFIIRIN